MLQCKRMTDEEIEQRTADVLTRLHHVRSQLDDAKIRAASVGEYSDVDWFKRAKSAHRILGVEHQLLLKEAADRKKVRRKVEEGRFERRFISISRERLHPEMFRAIMDEACGEDVNHGE